MKKKRWVLPLSIAGGLIILCIAFVLVFGAVLGAKGYSVSVGRLYFAKNGNYLIENGNMAMRVSDLSDNAELFKGYENGNKVILIHGGVDDSYPAQTDGYRVFRLSKGDKAYKPADEVLGIVTLEEAVGEKNHTHSPAESEQTVFDPFVGYCGNTQTTIYFENNKSYTFMSGNSVTVTDMLLNLNYDKKKLCKCLPEYTIDTEFGFGYGINLSAGYARCDKGQADLTDEQIEKLTEIISWAKSKAGIAENTSNFEFSLTWNTYGISSYDSKTGKLVKTNDATTPENYVTNLKLSEKQYSAIWKLIKGLDIESYPNEYNPHGNGVSIPYMTLILSVKTNEFEKTVSVKETMLSFVADNKKGQKFLDVCKGIEDIITETKEWKALPEYEKLYD